MFRSALACFLTSRGARCPGDIHFRAGCPRNLERSKFWHDIDVDGRFSRKIVSCVIGNKLDEYIRLVLLFTEKAKTKRRPANIDI